MWIPAGSGLVSVRGFPLEDWEHGLPWLLIAKGESGQ